MSDDEYSDAELTADVGKELELARQTAPRWLAPHFVWAVRDELTLKLCGEDTPSCEELDNGGLRVTTTVDLDLQKIAEKWVKGATIVPHRGATAGGCRQGARLRSLRALDAQPRGQERSQRRARRARLRDRRARRLRRLGRVLRDAEPPRVPAPVRRRRAGLPPAGFGVQAVQLRRRHRRRDHDRGRHVHGRRHGLRRRLHPERRGQPRARSRAAAQRAPVLAEHPVRQGDGPQHAGARVRAGQGLRHDLPERDDRCRPGPRPGRGRDPAGRPRVRLRHARQRRPADPTDDDPGGQGPRRRRTSCEPYTPPEGHAGGQPAGGLDRHRHPGRQHQPPRQPVLGRVRHRGTGRRPPAGDAEDRARTTTPRTSTRTATSPRRPRRVGRTARMPCPSGHGTATATTPPSAKSSRSTSRRSSGRDSCRRPAPSGRSRASSVRRKA